ncbi:transmembrane anchor protein, partial [Psychrobacter celer]
MYNSDTPLQAELPSSQKLIKSTILAAISAVVLL